MRPVTLLVLPAAIAAFTSGCGTRAETAPTPRQGVPVRTASVETRDLDDEVLLTGTLRPRRQVQLVAEVAARLVRLERDEGARVAAGDVVARLDETDYALAHERARAVVAVAEANTEHAATERERADNLLKTGGITDKDHLAAQVGWRVAQAALAQARAEAAIAAQQHSRALVRAPFSGRVATRHADPGSMLAAGTPVVTLVDDALFEFRAAVPSADYGRLKLGAAVELSIDALGGRKASGRVARITPLVDARTRAFEVTVDVPGDGALVGGLFARARVHAGRVSQARVVPPAALRRDGSDRGRAEVFVVSGGQAERRNLELGIETADAVQVLAGLSTGEVVVLDPPLSLAAGAPVTVQTGPRAR